MKVKADKMKPQELPGVIRRSGLAPLYLILGEEAFLRDEAVAMIKASLLEPSPHAEGNEKIGIDDSGDPGFNVDLVYADETDATEILNYAQEISFFSAKRL
ncbi:MAG: hypothetical protein GTO40_29855, partial [Deltaproteobacteria bacterium]|nr:hypothetical protein [Deltaproteobacteria bacterium]